MNLQIRPMEFTSWPAPIVLNKLESKPQSFQILQAHDLEPRSEIAFIRASRIAAEKQGQLTVVHAVSRCSEPPVIAARQAHAVRQIDADIRRWAGRDRAQCRIEVGVGTVVDVISAHVDPVDLIVMGARRRKSFMDPLTWTTAHRVLNKARRPVLVVNKADQSPYRRILVPIDRSLASIVLLRFAAEFVPGGCIHVLQMNGHSSRPDGNAQRRGLLDDQSNSALSKFLSRLIFDTCRLVIIACKENPSAIIRQELAKGKTDLVILGAHPSNAWGTLDHCALGAVMHAGSCDTFAIPLPGYSRAAPLDHQDITSCIDLPHDLLPPRGQNNGTRDYPGTRADHGIMSLSDTGQSGVQRDPSPLDIGN